MNERRRWVRITVLAVATLALAFSAFTGMPTNTANAAANPTETLFVNQSGYNLGKSKRFTAPLAADGTPFAVKTNTGGQTVFTGTITGQAGDFSDFNPAAAGEYYIEAGAARSVPFSVGPYWTEKVSYKPALDFMIDSRSWLGSVTNSTETGVAWRDSHQFSFEVPTLIQQYLANPSAYEHMQRQLKYGGRYNEPSVVSNGFLNGAARDAADPAKKWSRVPDPLAGKTYLLTDGRDQSPYPPFEDYTMYNVRAEGPVTVFAVIDAQKEPVWIAKDGWTKTAYAVQAESGGNFSVYSKSHPAGIIDLKRSLNGAGMGYVFDGAAVSLVQAPDIVELIRFGTEIIYVRNGNHTLLKEQLAYFINAYPYLKQWISEDMYQRVKEYAFRLWKDADRSRYNWYDIEHSANLLQTYTVFGTGKGQLPPGHSVMPNLFMYEAARRDGSADAQMYFDAAYGQTEWIINNLDWKNPTTTKGQRMSEHVTMEGLAYFQKQYPDKAPLGLLSKIKQWAVIMSARSYNMWDFRKYSDSTWVIPDNYNEPGNVAGSPASAFAAGQAIGEEALKRRLEQISMSQIDDVFGKNPYNRHFSFDASRDFEGVEYGWFKEYQGGAGALNNVRGVLDGSAKEAAYPYQPNSDYGYTEGCVAFNTAWNAALAYLSYDETSIGLYDTAYAGELDAVMPGQRVGIQLQAPLNLNYGAVEHGEAQIITSGGDEETVRVDETAASSLNFRAAADIHNRSVQKGNGTVEVGPDGWFEISYGYGLFSRSVRYVGDGTRFVKQTNTPPQTPSAEVEVTVPQTPVAIYPGSGGKKFNMELLNYTNENKLLRFTFTAPEGISITAGNAETEIPAYGGASVAFTAQAAKGVKQGTYAVPVAVSDEAGVIAQSQLQLVVQDMPQSMFDNFEHGSADGWSAVSGVWSTAATGGNTMYRSDAGSSTALSVMPDREWGDFDASAKVRYDQGTATGYGAGIVFRYQDSGNYYHLRLHQSNGVELYKWVNGTATKLAGKAFAWNAGTEYTMKVVVRGSSIIGYVNDQEMVNKGDSSLVTGTIGLRNYGGQASFDDVSVAPIYVDDNFENNKADGWTPVTGTWSTTPKDGSVVYQGDSQNGSSAALSVKGSAGWTDYEMSADVNMLQRYTGSGYSGGIVFRYKDQGNYYHFRLDSVKGAELFRWVNGTATRIAEKSYPWAIGTRYNLKIIAAGDHIQGFINGQSVIDTRDGSHTSGLVGLRAYNGIEAFDNVRVYPASVQPGDSTMPTIRIDGVVEGGSYTDSVSPSVQASDPDSGIQSVAVKLDDAVWESGKAVTDKGEHRDCRRSGR